MFEAVRSFRYLPNSRHQLFSADISVYARCWFYLHDEFVGTSSCSLWESKQGVWSRQNCLYTSGKWNERHGWDVWSPQALLVWSRSIRSGRFSLGNAQTRQGRNGGNSSRLKASTSLLSQDGTQLSSTVDSDNSSDRITCVPRLTRLRDGGSTLHKLVMC